MHRQGCDVAGSVDEFANDLALGELEDLRRVDRSVVVDVDELQGVAERLDVQLLAKYGLTVSNLTSGFDQVLVSDDFDLSLNNLGTDTERLEERRH